MNVQSRRLDANRTLFGTRVPICFEQMLTDSHSNIQFVGLVKSRYEVGWQGLQVMLPSGTGVDSLPHIFVEVSRCAAIVAP